MKKYISIHALRGEGDEIPARSSRIVRISIHALRGEGDHAKIRFCGWCQHFYPRPPRGGRPIWSGLLKGVQWISIHALRGEGDLQMMPPRLRK